MYICHLASVYLILFLFKNDKSALARLFMQCVDLLFIKVPPKSFFFYFVVPTVKLNFELDGLVHQSYQQSTFLRGTGVQMECGLVTCRRAFETCLGCAHSFCPVKPVQNDKDEGILSFQVGRAVL